MPATAGCCATDGSIATAHGGADHAAGEAQQRSTPSGSSAPRGQRAQPIARRMPISRVRSKTDMTIVFNMPTAPMTKATAEVIQAMALLAQDDKR